MTSIKVDRQEFLALASYVQGPLSVISPFRLVGDPAKETTRKSGPALLVNADGSLKAEYLPLVQTLAQPKSLGACTFAAPDMMIDTSLYYTADGGGHGPVALSQSEEGLELQAPPELGSLLEIMAQYIGDSVVREIELDAEMPLEEAAVLLAVVDVHRRHIFTALAKGITGAEVTLPVTEIVAAIGEDFSDLQWLAPLYLLNAGLEKPTAAQVQTVLEKLAGGGWFSLKSKKISPLPPLVDIAESLLLVDGHIKLQAAVVTEDSQSFNLTQVQMVRGRANAVLMLNDDGQTASLTCISPAQALLVAADMLGNPGTDMVVSQITPTITCPHCQTVLPAGKKFCTQCGKKIN